LRAFGIAAALPILIALGGCERADDLATAANLPRFDVKYCIDALDSSAEIPAPGCMAAPHRTYVMRMEPAGALIVAPVLAGGAVGPPIWTAGGHIPEKDRPEAILQGDGNFVIYDQGKPIWDSETSGSAGTYHLNLTDEGELILRGPEDLVLWSSKFGKAPAARPAT